MIILNDVCVVLGREIVLNNFSLLLETNDIYGLFGLNGAGKTTFLRTLSGLYEKSGEIIVNKLKSSSNSYQKQFFYFEFEGFLNHDLTPKIYFDYTAKVWNTSQKRIREAIDLFGIDFLNKKIQKFSFGMKQKTILAMYYISDAPIWLLDEPFNGLDFQAISSLERLLIVERARRIIIVSSHLIPHLTELTNKIIFIKDQEVVYTQTTDIKTTYCEIGLVEE